MSGFGKRIDFPGGRRRSARQAVVLAASALGFQRSMAVLVPDLSEVGAKLRGRALPEKGERLLIKFGETGLFATVAWCGRDECGIVFDQPIDARGVQRLQVEADWCKVMGFAA